MKPPSPKHDSRDVAVGTWMGFTAAVAYAIAIMVLRHLADRESISRAVWVSCVKAVPAAVVAFAMGLSSKRWGTRFFPPAKFSLMILASGLFMQFGSNVGFQWSLSRTGMAVTVPVSYASMLLLSAWMGKRQLGEHISLRAALSMGLLIVAIALLSGGAANARSDIRSLTSPVLFLSIGAALIAGAGWAWTGVVIRQAVTSGVSVAATIFLFSMSGVVGLGLTTIGVSGWYHPKFTTPHEFGWMFLAGAFNALAFFMLTAALQRITVVRTNLINASQIAMTTTAGVVLFQERGTVFLLFGTFLTIVGLFVMGSAKTEVPPSKNAVDA